MKIIKLVILNIFYSFVIYGLGYILFSSLYFIIVLFHYIYFIDNTENGMAVGRFTADKAIYKLFRTGMCNNKTIYCIVLVDSFRKSRQQKKQQLVNWNGYDIHWITLPLLLLLLSSIFFFWIFCFVLRP